MLIVLVALLLVVAATTTAAAPVAASGVPQVFDPSRPESALFQRIADAMPLVFGPDCFSKAESLLRQFFIVDIATTDNVTLRTRVFIPRSYTPGSPPLTALYDRTPYGAAYTALSMIWAIDGYAIIMQDQRGTGGSTGNFSIWMKDYEDGVATMDWISAQEWSNGKVVTWGISADAVSVYPLVTDRITQLKAMFPIVGVDNGHHLVFPQGEYRQGLTEDWLRSVCVPCIDDVKAHELYDEWWLPVNMTGRYGSITYPSVHIAGWWDIFLTGQIKAFKGFLAESDPSVRSRQQLVVEAHGHCYQTPYPAAFPGLLLGLQLGRQMFAAAHNENNDDESSHVQLSRQIDADAITFFVMGPIGGGINTTGNWYTTLPAWPAYEAAVFYLAPVAVLQPTASPIAATSWYFYDPQNPAEHNGGHNLGGTCGGLEQNEIEARDDVIAFSSAVFAADQAYVGPISVVLFVATDRNDTDFIVKINDVHPNGNSHLLSEGAVRMRLRDSISSYSDVVPGRSTRWQSICGRQPLSSMPATDSA